MIDVNALKKLLTDKKNEIAALEMAIAKCEQSPEERAAELESETMMTATGIDLAATTAEERLAIEEKDYIEHTNITREDLKKLLHAKAKSFRSEIKALIEENGAKTLSELPEDRLAAVYFAAQKLGENNAR